MASQVTITKKNKILVKKCRRQEKRSQSNYGAALGLQMSFGGALIIYDSSLICEVSSNLKSPLLVRIKFSKSNAF